MAEIIEAEVKSNIGEVTKDVEKLDKATDKASGGFKGVGNAIKGVGTAIKAAGIGLVVALFAKLMEVFSKNQKVLDFFNTSMTALSIAFNDLFSYNQQIRNSNSKQRKGYHKAFRHECEQLAAHRYSGIRNNYTCGR